MTSTPSWPARHAWTIFVLTSFLTLLFGLSGEEGPAGPDAPLRYAIAGDTTEVGQATALRGTMALGMGVFGLAIAIGPFRRLERWAWVASLVWPVFFALHIVAFGTWLPDGVFLALCVIALAATAPHALRRAAPARVASGAA